MSHPDDETLAALALGEPVPAESGDHARGCPSCSDDVAALRDTLTALRAPVPDLVAPPPSVWDAVQAEIAGDAVADAPASTDAPGSTDAGASAVVPADELSRRRGARQRRGLPLAWVAGAAAAGLVVGVAGTRLLDREEAVPAGTTVASTSLDTLDTQQVKGSADVVRHEDRLDLAVRTEPIDAADGYLEVWLINEDLQRMVSVGVLRPGETDQSFAIPQDLLDEGYVIVDISREGFDAAPEHSGDSVVRGTLAT
ncbi:hypothetical protein GCM10023168_37060 [Fodinibacter luteus]|uniref:Anti-sigma K factor RskA C-terminal domain-containing protein n=1 Tax=Fodinibacter luteus TaxID=552064 RepID=A0ABP8KRY3_9MICO